MTENKNAMENEALEALEPVIEHRRNAGRKGGSVRSARKLRAVRENGRKGGRPRSDNPTPAALAKRRSRARQAAKRQVLDNK